MRDEFEDDYYADDDDQQGWRGRFVERASTWAGAALALAVIGGLVFWAYGLGRRDATAIPVIRAALAPAKVQPDDPGGAVIEHQDITSYNAGNSVSAPPKITFAAPPERPTEADVAMGSLQDAGAETGETTPSPNPESPVAPGIAVGDGTEFAPAASQAAPRRPADLSEKMAAARQSVSAEADLAARAMASVVQIQLGAFPDRELTKSEWNRIYGANEDILAGRALVVQSTISGGQRFFRMRAGPFKDKVEAQNICRALQARGMDCIVTVNG
jgi:hypothetical protein